MFLFPLPLLGSATNILICDSMDYCVVLINLAKQGYCNHFVCLSVYLSICLSVCLFVCLFSVCPESIYIYIYIYTYYAWNITRSIMMLYHEAFMYFLLGEAGWGEVRWVRGGPTLPPLYPTLPHLTPLYPTLPHFTPLYPTLPHFSPLFPTLPHFTPFFPTFPHFTPFYPTLLHFSPLLTSQRNS